MKKTFCFFLFVLLIINAVISLSPGYAASGRLCRNITSACDIKLNGRWISSYLTDNNEETYLSYDYLEIVIDSAEPVGGVYIKFDRTPPVWTLSYKDRYVSCGQYGFLHEYQSVESDNVRSLSLWFCAQTSIADIFVISKGDSLPDFVQTWRPAEGYCDIMLLACHSDDDQLFFAGSVPDAVSRGAEMQVCYFTHHWKSHRRPHELLNGLWTCGLDRYPVIGRFPDIERVDSEEEMLELFAEKEYTYDQMVEDQVLLLRKYKPQIVLVHDVYGEYGHGAHRLDSHSLRDAALISNDGSFYPDSAKKYGLWDTPKIYIHLYEKNTVDFEIDVPLKRFGGKTAYRVSQDAFLCHKSQFSSRYTKWLLGTEEEPVTDSRGFPKYSPRSYGLWKTTVGSDKRKTDFYENVVLIKDQSPEQKIPVYVYTPEETAAGETTTEEYTTEETTLKETTAEETTLEETTLEDTAVEETKEETTSEETAAETVTEISEESSTVIAATVEETPDKDIKEEEAALLTAQKNRIDPIPVIICTVCSLAAATAVFVTVKKKLKK